LPILHLPSHIISRTAVGADEDDLMSLLLWQEGAMKSQLIAAVAADPKLILQIDLLDILRNLHTCRIDLPLDLLFRSSSLTAKEGEHTSATGRLFTNLY
jgi:hypothetical protein